MLILYSAEEAVVNDKDRHWGFRNDRGTKMSVYCEQCIVGGALFPGCLHMGLGSNVGRWLLGGVEVLCLV